MDFLNAKTGRLLALIGGILVMVWWWFPGSYDPVNYPPRASGPWIAFGDSLTAGQDAGAGDDYPTVLSRALAVPILNKGVNGETTAGALRRVDAALAEQPRVLLLCLGGNDALQQVPIDETFSNLENIIDRFLAEGTFVLLLGVRSASLRDKFADRFEDLARAKKVLLVPNILDGILGHSDLMSDYVHPNSQGYEVIAARIAAKLQPYLEGGLRPSSLAN